MINISSYNNNEKIRDLKNTTKWTNNLFKRFYKGHFYGESTFEEAINNLGYGKSLTKITTTRMSTYACICILYPIYKMHK